METLSTHSPALDRLTTLAAVLDAECLHLPDAATSLDASADTQGITRSAPLHLANAGFWEAASARDISRRELFVTSLELTLRDDVLLNIEEGELHREHSRCLPGMDAQEHVVFSALELQVDPHTCIELAGAIIATAQAGQTLLCLPGQSVEGFVSHEALLQALARRINHPVLRLPLLRLMHESTRQAWLEIGAGGDIFPEPISPADFQLKPVKGSPYEHALDQLLAKQRVDIDELLETGDNLSPEVLAARLEDRLRQPKSRERYVAGLMAYEQARSALTSVMGSAACAEQFARSHLRARLANDLGQDIDPDDVLITTERALPLTEQPYTVSRSLTQLALYGLH
nr:hypothetical protein [Tanacetum cinerariifolium]